MRGVFYFFFTIFFEFATVIVEIVIIFLDFFFNLILFQARIPYATIELYCRHYSIKLLISRSFVDFIKIIMKIIIQIVIKFPILFLSKNVLFQPNMNKSNFMDLFKNKKYTARTKIWKSYLFINQFIRSYF